MTLAGLMESIGEGEVLALGGLTIGLLFGICAQRSRFCLRSAVIETCHGQLGNKLAVWLLAFSGAIILTQAFILTGILDVSNARQLAARGTLSGALIGGLLFGTGMILARGCSSRLLILAGTGNLRSLLSGLVFAVVAQASLAGILSPLRIAISNWWTIDGGTARNLLDTFHLGNGSGVVFGLIWLVGGVFFSIRSKIGVASMLTGFGVGAMVATAWLFTYQIASEAFEVTQVKSLSFTGPAADVLMLVLSPPGHPWNFDIGLVPGVFIGSFLSARFGGELKLEGFKDGLSMRRYIIGAVCMGFGGTLAGGCAVGAGVSGAAVFALTAWVTLCGMWIAAGLTDYLVDRRPLAA
ncbi:MAG TPA: YeeE/YedE family protein [Noviherbaspirillum sp.]|uniref:YeeE/YedE family protein n=1 Tax=Noviherbaspirillum sp. TaxID=1926288 RepID=UPI002B496765|nr:YeeE/YedE family protein [Noviherbaspirillum sp.]HJV85318.1 YeeE/YedE family protein [Noviherbaspirillum sp.]